MIDVAEFLSHLVYLMNYDIFQGDASQAQYAAKSFTACPGFHLFIIAIVWVRAYRRRQGRIYPDFEETLIEK